MWDYQTCTFAVEHIGFSPGRMFPPRPWTMEWLRDHCARRFGVTPQPLVLQELWGFDEAGLKAQGSRILFTGGDLDGWTAGGITRDLDKAKGLLGVRIPQGAHHSDLFHAYPVEGETQFMERLHASIVALVGSWLEEVCAGASPGSLTKWDYGRGEDGASPPLELHV